MRLPSLGQLIWQLWTLPFLLSLSFAQIQVPIRMDRSMTNSIGQPVYFYSLVMDFPYQAVLSDKQLAWLAKEAYTAMMALPVGITKADDPPLLKRPAVMSALRVDRVGVPGTTVYFASSMRRDIQAERKTYMTKIKVQSFPGGITQGPEAAELEGACHACQVTHTGGHGHDLKCGEPLALTAFYKAEKPNDGNPWEQMKKRNLLMAAYSGEHEKIIKPCTVNVEGKTYGCMQLLDKLEVEWVAEGTAMEPVTSADPLRPNPQICLGSK
ncbi:hypothetical protein EJ04DRAFT_529123 [Polyplosphaeria fusca]|uniref:Uncharacterized protein n=1 Tax=Polyplosphaeria fusca TaxID=682080 RepID=A0A9P4QN21_9PLEO|nr:hypothetical protein EJ04DRAFT_529123 [Polyplosphaeria fusca]